MKTSLILAFVASSVCMTSGYAAGDGTADLILGNGRVYTLEESQPWAQALVIRGEWLLTVGTDAEAPAFTGADTRETDLGGAFVSPGFNDSHVHVDGTGRLLTGMYLLDVHEAGAFRERLRVTTASFPDGSWITRSM